MIIADYSINGYQCLLLVIILMVIGAYYWLLYYNYCGYSVNG